MGDRDIDGDAASMEASVAEQFTAMYTEYRVVILMAAYRRLGVLQDAEDVTTEVFRAAWSHREDATKVFRPGWLYAALRNLVGNEYRRRDRAGRLFERLVRFRPDGDMEPTSDIVLIVREAVASLPQEDQELIGMVYWDEATREETAHVLGCSVNAVNLRLQRVRRKILASVSDVEVSR